MERPGEIAGSGSIGGCNESKRRGAAAKRAGTLVVITMAAAMSGAAGAEEACPFGRHPLGYCLDTPTLKGRIRKAPQRLRLESFPPGVSAATLSLLLVQASKASLVNQGDLPATDARVRRRPRRCRGSGPAGGSLPG